MINLRQLKNFLVLAETLHYGRAADILFITQPSLSRQIAALEKEGGFPLFERHSRSVTLTKAGQAFVVRVREIVNDLDDAIRVSKAIAEGNDGRLRIAFSTFFSGTLLPPAIKIFSERFPGVDLILNELSPTDLVDTVDKASSDISLLLKISPPSHLSYRSLHSENICAVLPENHHLSDSVYFTPSLLKNEPFIVSPREITPTLFDAVYDCCISHGFKPDIKIRTHLQQTIVNFVAEGLGVAFVPESMISTGTKKVVFRIIDNSPKIEFGALWRKNNPNPFVPDMINILRGLSEGK